MPIEFACCVFENFSQHLHLGILSIKSRTGALLQQLEDQAALSIPTGQQLIGEAEGPQDGQGLWSDTAVSPQTLFCRHLILKSGHHVCLDNSLKILKTCTILKEVSKIYRTERIL